MRLHTLLLASSFALLGVTSIGCVGGSKGITSEDKERLKAYVLDAPPADMPHKLDVNFENKVHLVGYKFDPETAKPGQDARGTEGSSGRADSFQRDQFLIAGV